MLQFFRKIRKKLLAEGKISQYATYALGEIVLVVAGILIALSINNWNEDRINKRNIRLMLTAVQLENQINIHELEAALKDSDHVRNTLIALLRNMGSDFESKDKFLIDSLFYEGLSLTTYDPNRAAILNLMESSHLKLIQDDSLKHMLLEWNSKLERLLNSEASNLHIFKTIVIPHFYDKLSLVSIDRTFTAGSEDLPPSAFKHDNREALGRLVTENILEDHLYNLTRMHHRYQEFYTDLLSVNQLIEKELH